MTGLYALLHFFVDGICAWAMLGRLEGDFGGILIYNFCASILRAVGDTKRPLYFLTISGIANVPLLK